MHLESAQSRLRKYLELPAPTLSGGSQQRPRTIAWSGDMMIASTSKSNQRS